MGSMFKGAKEMKYSGDSINDHIDVFIVCMREREREREMGSEGKDVRNKEKRIGKDILGEKNRFLFLHSCPIS